MVVDILSQIHKLKDSKGNFATQRIRMQANADLINEIKQQTYFLNENCSITERIYCIQHNITQPLTCEHTGKILKWDNSLKKYRQSIEGGMITRDTSNSIKNIKQLHKDIKHNLVDIYYANKYVLLSREDVLKEYRSIKTSVNTWCLRDNPDLFCSILKYTDFMPSPILNRGKGFEKWQRRIFYIENHITVLPKQLKRHNAVNFLNNKFDILSDISYAIGLPRHIEIRCKACNSIKKQLMTCGHWQRTICNTCTQSGFGRSSVETEIVEWLKSHKIDNILCNQSICKDSQLEVDILLPDYNIALEYNGVLWHSFGTTFPNTAHREKDKKHYHLLKYNLCQQNNIQLITIFENEWKNNKDLVKSIILSKLGITSNRIYARKCEIRQIDSKVKSIFLNNNHIQGNCQSFLNIGLYYNDELVSLMTFSNRKMGKNNATNITELARFCNKKDTTVIGGFSKLLKCGMSLIKRDIISYCDIRYSKGDIYLNNGFTLARQTPPNYFYIKRGQICGSRVKYQKHKLSKMIQIFDNNLTERENMYNNKYRRIYDCGNYVYIKKYL